MAILQMKKLSITVLASQREALLKKLIKLGCVQFDEQAAPVAEEGEEVLFRPVDTALSSLKSRQAVLANAITLANRYVPEKTPLLAPTPEVEGDRLLDGAGIAAAEETARKLVAAEDRVKRIGAEESRQRALIKSLQPWESLPLRLETEGTEYASVLLGTVSTAKYGLAEINEMLNRTVPEAEVFPVSSEGKREFVAVVCLKDKLSETKDALNAVGFSQISFPGMNGTARDCINLAKAELNALGKEKESNFDVIAEAAGQRKAMQLASDKLEAEIAMASAEEKLLATEQTVVMQGWVPAESEKDLERLLEDFVCAWETEDPSEEEYGEVPVKLKNNKITNGLNMVTNMYSLPRYGTVDPNPLMAPFFILFYGLMMADMGYGIIMVAAALVAMKKAKPKDGMLSFCQLLLWCGIATFAMGALTGGFFSDIPYQLVHVFNPESTWEGIPYVFSPVYQSEAVLYGSMILGALHLNAGMVVSFVQKKKAGQLADAIWEEGSLWLLLVGGILAVLKIGNVAGIPVVLILGIIALLFGAGRNAKGFGKVTAAFSCIYNTATGWFGDVLSYSRIMALMLAGGVVGQVFNTVAVMPMQNGVNVVTVIAFILIFLLGHAMNFGLNLLGCYVHDLRLQCLEFFGKFYVDGGKAFTPLKFGGKYVRAKEN